MKDFAKIINREDVGQVLITNLFDEDEDMYCVKISYHSASMGGCFIEGAMFFNEEDEAQEAFDSLMLPDDLEGMLTQ